MCAFAVEGSKLEGTGLEKLQMVQTHVAGLDGVGSTGGGRYGLSVRFEGVGVPFPLRERMELSPSDRGWREGRLAALGINVIFAEDLRKPALR